MSRNLHPIFEQILRPWAPPPVQPKCPMCGGIILPAYQAKVSKLLGSTVIPVGGGKVCQCAVTSAERAGLGVDRGNS